METIIKYFLTSCAAGEAAGKQRPVPREIALKSNQSGTMTAGQHFSAFNDVA